MRWIESSRALCWAPAVFGWREVLRRREVQEAGRCTTGLNRPLCCVSHPNYPISQPRSGLLHQHWALQQDNYCSQMRSAVEAQAKAILLNSFLQSGPVWRNYHHTTPQCHFYIPLKVISCPPLGSMFFKCDERSLSMLIVRVCVRECQFALAIKVPQTGWIPACSPPTDIRQTLNM